MPTPPKPPFMESDEDSVNLERVVFFSDAVFAIAITLLALEIRLPEVDADALPQAIIGLLPEIAVYALSFLIVGLYWVGHHRMFHYIARYDYTLIWLNLFFLLCIAFLPVASNILGHYKHPFAVLFYCSVLCITSLMSVLLWWYASHNHRLIESDVEPHVIRYVFNRSIATIVVALLAAGVAFINTTVALVILGIYATLAIVFGRLYAVLLMNISKRPRRSA
jgi:uncharacterized membrane protein